MSGLKIAIPGALIGTGCALLIGILATPQAKTVINIIMTIQIKMKPKIFILLLLYEKNHW